MRKVADEPVIAVGLMTVRTGEARFLLQGGFETGAGQRIADGAYRAMLVDGGVSLQPETGPSMIAPELNLRPVRESTSSFTVRDVIFGIDFHWERKEDQTFRGALKLARDSHGNLLIINMVRLEDYLASVISSEMSATSNPELLRAHSIISRSWLLAQIKPWYLERQADRSHAEITTNPNGERELIRWYAREAHQDFDVCADDHCQRYQGVTRATEPRVFETIRTTRGRVLVHGDWICDARFSKCCGGMVEAYDAVWDPTSFAYLQPLFDGKSLPGEFELPLTDEENARRWILGSPPAYCNITDRTVLAKVLPCFDQETSDFFRWRVTIEQEELQALLLQKLGLEFGAVIRMEPVERAASGRLIRLRIVGQKATLVIGKELEIRRALSKSHLYSSAFIVEADDAVIPKRFTLIGAGWGHGVGLCQIGAALMAEEGIGYPEILCHYYPGATLHLLYD